MLTRCCRRRTAAGCEIDNAIAVEVRSNHVPVERVNTGEVKRGLSRGPCRGLRVTESAHRGYREQKENRNTIYRHQIPPG